MRLGFWQTGQSARGGGKGGKYEKKKAAQKEKKMTAGGQRKALDKKKGKRAYVSVSPGAVRLYCNNVWDRKLLIWFVFEVRGCQHH